MDMKKKILSFLWLAFLLFSVCNAQPNANSPMAMNLDGLSDWNREMPFQDVFKQSRTWISQLDGQSWGTGPELDLDANGWVKTLNSADHYVTSVVLLDIPSRPTGNYHVFYDGEGSFHFWSGASFVEEVEPGHIIIDVAESGSLYMDITETDPEGTGNYIRNIQVVPEKFLDTYQTETFNPDFLDLWDEIKVLRFMDWLETNNSDIETWADRTTPDTYTQTHGSIAYEYIIELCNINKADPWICIPHLADDDYVTRVAEMFRDNLDPELKVYIEYSNEVWNGQFDQADYADNKGVELGFAPASEPWKGKAPFFAYRSCQIFEIFESVYGGTDKLERVLAWQNFNVGGAAQIMDFEYEPGKPASLLTDALAIAPYFGGFLGSANTQNEVQNYTPDQVMDILEHSLSLQTEKTRWQYDNAHSRTNDRGEEIRLIAYEGGQHLAGTGGAENNEQLTALFHEVNRHPRMRDVYFDYYNRWKAAGGEVFAVFSSMGDYTKWGSWGILESYEGVSNAPKYGATMAFNRMNQPPWWTVSPEAEPALGDQLLSFNCTDITGSVSLNKTSTTNGTVKMWEFGTADGENLFSAPDDDAANFYGGFIIDSENPDDLTREPSLNSTKFRMALAGGDGEHSKAAGLFMWRKDQFINGYDTGDNIQISKLELNLVNAGREDNEIRFVVKNGDQYYISDKVTLSDGIFSLTNFNNNSKPEKRWKEFNPSATGFEIPYPIAGTHAVNLSDIEEVGFIFKTERDSWSHGFEFDSFNVWATDGDELTVNVNVAESQDNPSAISPVHFTAEFSLPVSDFTADDVSLDGSAMPTTAEVTEIAPNDGTTYDIAVSGMSLSGDVIVSIPSGVATYNSVQNTESTSLLNVIRYNIADQPTVTVNQAATQPDPDMEGSVFFTAVFNEAVSGFGDVAEDVNLLGTAGASGYTITEIEPNDGTTYQIEVSGMDANGTVEVEIPAGAALNDLGAANMESTSTDNVVEYFVSNPPAVTINQSAEQLDPAYVTAIAFTVVFNQPVTGFVSADVQLSGTANPQNAVVSEVSPNDGTTYKVSVSGMTSDGSVIARIPAGVAKNDEDAWNLASTSTDNEVQFFTSMIEGGTIINFQGVDIPGESDRHHYNRELQVIGNDLYIPFSTADGDNLFSAGNQQCDFYGGAYYFNTSDINNGLLNSSDDGWAPNRFVTSYTGDGVDPDRPSEITLLFMWRKDQFMNNMDRVSVGFDNDPLNSKLSFHSVNMAGDSKIRFVIRQNGTYYISEFEASSSYGLDDFTAELTEFNNSDVEGKRWGEFNPSSEEFKIPDPLPAFSAVNFNDITEVGVILSSARDNYINAIEFDAFTVDAIAIDNTGPVAVFDPVDGEQNVAVDKQVTLQFNEAVFNADGSDLTNADLNSVITFKEGDENGADAMFTGEIDAEKKIMTLTPDQDLDNDQDYYLSLNANKVEDEAGNENSQATAVFRTQPLSPVLTEISITPGNASVTTDETIQFSAEALDQDGSPMDVDFTWSVTGDGSVNNGLFVPGSTGTFIVTVSSGDIENTAEVIVSESTGIVQYNSTDIHVFPNPAKDYFNVSLPDEMNADVFLTDLKGEQIMKLNRQSGDIRVDVSGLNTGVYVVKIVFRDSITLKKIIVL